RARCVGSRGAPGGPQRDDQPRRAGPDGRRPRAAQPGPRSLRRLDAAVADGPTAVLTGPGVVAEGQPGLIRLPRAMVNHDMVLVGLEDHPLPATAAVVWNGDL